MKYNIVFSIFTVAFVVFWVCLGIVIGVHLSEKNIRHEYPYLYNAAPDRDPQPGDIWLTHNPARDTFAVSVYRGGWQRVYSWPEK